MRETPDDTPTPTPMPSMASLRVVHASPNAPAVDIFVDGTAVLEGVSFGAVSGYLDLPAGSHTIEITAAGDSMNVVFSGDVSLDASSAYTVVASGEIGEMVDQPFEPLILTDDIRDPGPDTVRLAIVHASPDAPAVDITTAESGDTLVDGLAFGDSGVVEVPTGEYTVQIRADTPDSDGDIVAEYVLDLDGGTVYTGLAVGYLSPDDEPGDEPFNLLVATAAGDVGPAATPTPMPSMATLRAVHASPNAPAVDVFVDGTLVLEGVEFGAISGYLSLAAGTYTVEITAVGDPSAVVFNGDVTLQAETDYTVVAAGELGEMVDQPFAPVVLADDNTDPGGESARIQLVHASPDAPPVDVTVANSGELLFEGVAYGESASVEVPSGSYTIDIRAATTANDGDVVASYDLKIEGGTVYTAFAVGYLTSDDEPGDTPFDLVIATHQPSI